MSDVSVTFATIAGEIGDCLGKVSVEEVEKALDEFESAPRIFLAGAGRSALGIRGFAMRLMHLGGQAYVVGETTTPSISSKDLLLIGSGSGRTPSLLAAAEKAKEIGAKVVLITIDRNSPIAQLADVAVVIPAPSPKAAEGATEASSIQSMGSLFEQSLFVLLDSCVLLMMRRLSISEEEMFDRHANLE